MQYQVALSLPRLLGQEGAHLPQAGTSYCSTKAVVEAALTIIRWTCDDPERDGLIEAPARLARSFEEFFVEYGQDPTLILQKTFEEIEGYGEMIVLRGIRFESHCEHHLAQVAVGTYETHSQSLFARSICLTRFRT